MAEDVDVVAALAQLVELKDGPRDERYAAEKDAAWMAARDALARSGPCLHREPGAVWPCLLRLNHEGEHDDDAAKQQGFDALRRLRDADAFGIHYADCPYVGRGAGECECTAGDDVAEVLAVTTYDDGRYIAGGVDERAAVVAWLRADWDFGEDGWVFAREAIPFAADRIERGEHRG